MEPGQRLHALDSLRAMAMFLGIVLHGFASFAAMLPLPWIVRDVSASPFFDLAMGIIHGFRMPLFFFIAGFFAHLGWRRYGTREFTRRRWRRIGLPFLLGMATLVPLSILVFIWADTGAPRPVPQGPPTMHLWFLEMLLVLYALAMLAVWVGERWKNAAALALALDRGFAALLRHRGKAFVLAFFTILPLWNGPSWGEVDYMGQSILLAPRAVAYFALFFAAGWWLHRNVGLLDHLRGGLAIQFTIASLALVGWFGALFVGARAADPPGALKLAALAAAALYAWTMTFALTGLFLRIASRDRPWARYLADASYWCYLAHLPLLFVLQVCVADIPGPGAVKAWLVIAVACALLLASYELLVRHTWLGEMLNGPRGSGVRSSA